MKPRCAYIQVTSPKCGQICPVLPGPKAFEILLSGLERTHRIMAEESHRATVFPYESSGEGTKKKKSMAQIHSH